MLFTDILLMQYVLYVCVQEGEVVSIQISQGVGYLVSMEQGQIFSYRVRENQGPNYVDCVGYTFVDSFIYLKHVWECLKDCQMVKKGLLGKIQILVNWVIFEASYIFCCALAKKCQLTQHTSGYVKPVRRLKIKVRVERF